MRKSSIKLLFSLLAVGLAFGLPQTIIAQDQPPDSTQPEAQAQGQPDPPGRVARLNYIQGSVSFQPAGTQQWIDANPNRPLTTGDNLWADQNSRGELHVGSTAIRLSAQTGFSILNLNDQAVQIEVAQGSIELHVRDIANTQAYEVDTPNLAMTILRPGDYRIDVDSNGTSSAITLRSGSAEITAAGKAYSINPGQQYVFTGSDQLTYDAHPAPGRDEFDSWSVSRDQLEDGSQSAKYVSRDVIGYEDLDRNGVWRNEPEYGAVWMPGAVPVGWAPYHYGHWVYVAPWGWTWVEDEPWGFAPFHYGRWALVAGGWGWVPGPVVAAGVRVRPVYAPALVGFVGGGGFSVSFAIGGAAGVAWFPLGPRDVWVPGYHASAMYFRNVNITNTRVVNVTQVNNVYVNRTTVVNNYTYAHNTVAVTAVSRETFVNGQAVGRASVRVSADEINHPRVMESARLEPTQRSAFGSAASARALPPAALASRPVVTRMTPSARAVALGHTQPLVSERAAYRPSAPPNGGHFSRPASSGGRENSGGNNSANENRENRTPPSGNHPGGNANVMGSTNGNRESGTNADKNSGYRPFQPPSKASGNAPEGSGNNHPGNSNQARSDVQSRPAVRPNGAVQPPAQTNRNVNRNQPEDRRVQGAGNSGAQPHESNRSENPPKKEKKEDEHK
jgi:hypothetical protein